MVAIKLPIFSGMMPSVDKHLLPDSNAQHSMNVWLYSGALVGMPKKVDVHTLVDPTATVAFRVPVDSTNSLSLYESMWLEFQNSNTDFISAPVAADAFRRYYFTSSSHAPKYNTVARIALGQPAWLLGVPQPGIPIVVPSGGVSATIVSRAYLTTLVTEYGEEGPASTPVLVNDKVDATYTVTVAAVPAADRGVDRNVKKIRIYRTITTAQGTATYYLLHEMDALGVTQNYADTVPDATLASNTILESTAWTGPPDLTGFITMPNGVVAGYIRNELWFSEPYRPHAWPAAYSLTLEHDIVGLGIINQTLVVCTSGNPYTASGVNPANIATSKLALFEPCVSKGSIVSTEEGVFYMSPNGLILVNPGMAANTTRMAISSDKWGTILGDGPINAGRLSGAYIAFSATEQVAFNSGAYQEDTFQMGQTIGSSDGFTLDTGNSNVGFGLIHSENEIKSIYNDQLSGECLAIHDGKVIWFDQRAGFKTEPYVWRTKVFQTPDLKNFAAFRVYFQTPEDFTPSLPPVYDIGQTFDPDNQYGIIRVYADGRLVLAFELRTSGEIFRVPTGFKAEFWEIQFEAVVKINSFQMATSVKELSVV